MGELPRGLTPAGLLLSRHFGVRGGRGDGVLLEYIADDADEAAFVTGSGGMHACRVMPCLMTYCQGIMTHTHMNMNGIVTHERQGVGGCCTGSG